MKRPTGLVHQTYTASLCRVGGAAEVVPYEQTSFTAADDNEAIGKATEWLRTDHPTIEPRARLVVKQGARAIYSETVSSYV